MIPERPKIIEILADNYYFFLNSIPFNDESKRLYVNGMKEARTKFLANLHITLIEEKLPPGRKQRWYGTDYVSEKALRLLKDKNWEKNELVYEHIVPKSEYIRDLCEKKAKEGDLNKEFIKDHLEKYFWTATIHRDENRRLSRKKMPMGWKWDNIFARYDEANKDSNQDKIILVPHDKTYIFT